MRDERSAVSGKGCMFGVISVVVALEIVALSGQIRILYFPPLIFLGDIMSSKVYQVSDEEFIQIISNANSYSDCLRALGLTPRGGSSSDILKRRIKELGCSIEHFGKKPNSNSSKYSLDEILVENSSYTNIARLKIRLVAENKLEYKCAFCGNTGEWYGQKLVLQLDHINGINNDHRIDNLRFLCPNCHSITDTYAGKNIGNQA